MSDIFGPQVQTGRLPEPDPEKPIEVTAEIIRAPDNYLTIKAPPPPSLDVVVERDLNQNLTVQQKANLSAFSQAMCAGHANAAPLICQGLSCPFLKNCPLYQNGVILPEGKSCPVEQVAVNGWKYKFYESAGVTDNTPNRDLIYSLLDDVVGFVIIQQRILWEAAQRGQVVREECIGLNADREPIYATRLDPSYDLFIRLTSSKMKILKELLATPKAQVEAKRYANNDPSTQAAKALAQLAQLQGVRRIESSTLKVDLSE
jgi:hypothetical protein